MTKKSYPIKQKANYKNFIKLMDKIHNKII